MVHHTTQVFKLKIHCAIDWGTKPGRIQTGLSNKKRSRKSVHDLIPAIVELFRIPFMRTISFLLCMRQNLKARFPLLHLVHAQFLCRTQIVEYQICSLRLIRVHLSRRVKVDVFNYFLQRLPPPPEMNSLFHDARTFLLLALRVLLIVAKSLSIEQRRSLYIRHLLLP